MPFYQKILPKQSTIPLYYLWVPLPISTPNLVLTNSKGKTKIIELDPAIPPARILVKSYPFLPLLIEVS
jgi:hypothetical protein